MENRHLVRGACVLHAGRQVVGSGILRNNFIRSHLIILNNNLGDFCSFATKGQPKRGLLEAPLRIFCAQILRQVDSRLYRAIHMVEEA